MPTDSATPKFDLRGLIASQGAPDDAPEEIAELPPVPSVEADAPESDPEAEPDEPAAIEPEYANPSAEALATLETITIVPLAPEPEPVEVVEADPSAPVPDLPPLTDRETADLATLTAVPLGEGAAPAPVPAPAAPVEAARPAFAETWSPSHLADMSTLRANPIVPPAPAPRPVVPMPSPAAAAGRTESARPEAKASVRVLLEAATDSGKSPDRALTDALREAFPETCVAAAKAIAAEVAREVHSFESTDPNLSALHPRVRADLHKRALAARDAYERQAEYLVAGLWREALDDSALNELLLAGYVRSAGARARDSLSLAVGTRAKAEREAAKAQAAELEAIAREMGTGVLSTDDGLTASRITARVVDPQGIRAVKSWRRDWRLILERLEEIRTGIGVGTLADRIEEAAERYRQALPGAVRNAIAALGGAEELAKALAPHRSAPISAESDPECIAAREGVARAGETAEQRSRVLGWTAEVVQTAAAALAAPWRRKLDVRIAQLEDDRRALLAADEDFLRLVIESSPDNGQAWREVGELLAKHDPAKLATWSGAVMEAAREAEAVQMFAEALLPPPVASPWL